MKRLFGLATAALLALSVASHAADCGDDIACGVDGGIYHVELPDGAGPHPALMFLHGWGGSGEGQMRSRAMIDAVLARGYAFIAPTGQPRGQERNGNRWASYGDHPFMEGLRNDVNYLGRVADAAATRFPIDRNAIVLGGFSGGGMMAWRVACDAPEQFSAYVPIAGLMWRPLPTECAGPVRLLHTHGWADPVVPIEGRAVAGGRLTQGDLFTGLDLMRRANGCRRDDPDTYAEEGAFLRRAWTDCAPGSALEFVLHPGGHATPNGWTTMALDWVEALDGRPAKADDVDG